MAIVVMPATLAPSTFEQVTVGTQAATLASLLTSGIPVGARHVWFTPEGDVRFTLDGTDPTSAIGLIMASGVLLVIDCQAPALAAMKLIAGTSTKLNCQFFTDQQ